MNTVSPDDMFSGGMVTMHMYTVTWDGGFTRFPHLVAMTDDQAIRECRNQGVFPGPNPKVSVVSTTTYRPPIELKTTVFSIVELTND